MDFGQPSTIDDLDEVGHVLNAASPFDHFPVEHVRAAVFDDPNYDPDLLWCRRSGRDLTSVVAGVVRRPMEGTTSPTGYIKLFAVEPQYQGLGFGGALIDAMERRVGIGGVLLKRCLADLRDAGHPTVDIQWVGPIAFYSRQVGATLSRCFWQLAKTLPVG